MTILALMLAATAGSATPLAAPTPVFRPEVFFAGATEGHATLKVILHSRKPVHVIGHGRNDHGTLILDQTVMQQGKKPEVNDDKSYDNGVKVVPAYLLEPKIVTKDNAAEVYKDDKTLGPLTKG